MRFLVRGRRIDSILNLLALTAMASSQACAQPTQTKIQETLEHQVLQERSDRLIVALPNRLIVIAQELHTTPVVSAQVYVKTGSIYEQQHVGAGLSHFLEHLVSGGTTENRSETESNAALGRIGALTNASTGLAHVRYYINTTSTHTHDAIELLSDWLQYCQVNQREYERERDVIQREFEMGRGEPGRIFWKMTQQARFQAHPARHPTIGYLDDFLAVSRDEIYAFFKQMYVPNNIVFVVVGDIDKQQVVDQVSQLWTGSVAGPLPGLSFPEEPPIAEPRRLTGTADIDRPRLRLAWPGTELAGEGDYALDLLAVILGQGESSRLVRIVRDQHRAVNQIDAYNLSFHWGEGFFGIDAEIAKIVSDNGKQLPDPEALTAAKQLVLEQVQHLRREGITTDELARAKRKIIADTVYGAQSVQGLAGRMASDLIGMGDPDYLHQYARQIRDISSDEVVAAADRFLSTNRMITITLMPGESGKKTTALTRPDESTRELPHAAVHLDNAALIEKLRTVRSDTQNGPIVTEPVQMHRLPNGLRLVIGRSTLVPAVAIQMYRLGGMLADTSGREGLARATARMRVRGTANRSAEQIAQLIDDIGASISTDGGNNTSFTRAVCLKEDLDTVLELFADVVLNPSFDVDEWEKMRPRLLADIDRQTDGWHGELRHHFRNAYFGGEHPWSRSPNGNAAAIRSFTADDLAQFYGQRLSAAESVLAIFGDVDSSHVIQLVEQLFSDLSEKPVVAFDPMEPALPQAGRHEVLTDKPLGAVTIGFGPGPTRRSEDFDPVQVLCRVLSRWPSGWLEQALRGQGEGLVYAVGCGQFSGLVPGYIGITFNASPQKLDEALQRTSEVVDRARTELVSDQTLTDTKSALLTREFFYNQSNGDRAAKYALDELYGLGLDHTEMFIKRIESLDAEQIRAIAGTYLQNPVTVVLEQRPPESVEEAVK